AGNGTIARLEQLGQLRDAGAISPQEFEAQKARILADG
ncbi:MAG: Short C-terminal domain, partial [Pseudonocardiales bacterium]|nr:Short C-terminal domain [Pseudonocardiales bacterium]